MQNVIVQKVYAKDFTVSGVHFTGVDHVLLKDCVFESTSVTTGIGFETRSSNGANSYVRHVIMKRCTFKTDHAFFLTGDTHNMSGDSMRFEDCRFIIESAVIGYRQAPGRIIGVIEHAAFVHCDFEIESFTTSQSSIGLFFYFDYKNNTDMHWHFDSCRFINHGTVTANSPIMVFNNSNHYKIETEHIFVTVRNCLIRGFRWLIRYGTASGTLYHYIDPAFSGYPIDIDGGATPRQDAIDALNAVHRVLARNNYYIDETINNEYHLFRRAEEFGF